MGNETRNNPKLRLFPKVTGSTQLQSQTFGVLSGAANQINTLRNRQLALKLYF